MSPSQYRDERASNGRTSATLDATRPAEASTILRVRYEVVRRATEALCEPLTVEDHVVQTLYEVSPTKWHLAHTSWFFETFVLCEHTPDYRPLNSRYRDLFNSYYKAVGPAHSRGRRGVLSRPTLEEVYRYRRHVDAHMMQFLERQGGPLSEDLAALITLGLHHEQQHQELILTDIKHVFACNPLRPAYRAIAASRADAPPPLAWQAFPAGVQEIGHDGDGFAFDCEAPRHSVYLGAFRLATRPVTNGEFVAFIEDGGYGRPALWLSDGWDAVQSEAWSAPLYWERRDGRWWTMTLGGMQRLNEAEPVCHVSYFEADAYARWSGARLPSEAEWEIVARTVPMEGNFLETDHLHPVPGRLDKGGSGSAKLFGDVWEWTASPFAAYPGYRLPAGALGEYNGKFMCNQMVLRGGSCLTPRSHTRPTYRNFFPPQARWQVTGLRLAQEI
ncbi:MAG: ergothioneine biosynthesis protein EgtB [Phycisphaerae bacterium]